MVAKATLKFSAPTPLALAVLCAATVWVSCNRASCDGLHAPSEDADAAELTFVEMLESQANNPWGLVFALSFAGGTGQVADGNLLIYTGASAPAVLPLQDAFASSGLRLDATAGRIAVPLTLSQGGVEDDTTVRLGFQIEDAAGRFSNCFSLDIHVDISLATTARAYVPRLLYGGRCRRPSARWAGRHMAHAGVRP